MSTGVYKRTEYHKNAIKLVMKGKIPKNLGKEFSHKECKCRV